MTAHKKHGGARPGAGRKPKANVAATARLEIRLTPAERAEMNRRAKAEGLCVTDYIRARCISSEQGLTQQRRSGATGGE